MIDIGILEQKDFKDLIKIDLTTKLYQHIGDHLYFYR